MIPVWLSTHNHNYRGDGESVGDLSGVMNEDGSFTCHFELSDEEVEEMVDAIQNGDFLVELTIHGRPIPPVSVKAIPR